MSITTLNPATGEIIHSYDEMSWEHVDQILEQMSLAQQGWAETTFEDRAKVMMRLVGLLKRDANDLASITTMEMGKIIGSARAEIEKCQWVCEHYAENAAQYLSDYYIETSLSKSYVTYQPLGAIFAIMPWNYPFWQVFRFVAPNLMAGNACLLSHAPASTGAALKINALIQEAGFPPHLFNVVIGDNDLSHKIIQDSRIAGVTLTGSENAGSRVAQTAGAALKKVVLELGGSDPYVVLADADLSLAADQIIKSRMNNSGQVCISAKRVIVDVSVHDDLLTLLSSRIASYQYGDPMNPETKLGPLARQDLRDKVHEQVEKSIESGAKCLTGGFVPDEAGYYYPATLLDDVKPGMPAFDDEIFGPVVCVCKANDESHAIQLANQTRFGLSAVVFTQDKVKGELLARKYIQAGTCYVNGLVSSDPNLPFGGIKASGYGRELSAQGIHEFVNIKTVGVV